ncbi:signal recognition particle-docking protein FtsY [Shewanella baltica]|uniref:signal recognition particle-docking protein FtsY n=1 Tax=Shewanella baltica TaxID=62322 RepID=UPI00217DA11E|nr:signal recognition particle-docking protein FtsY [Shewanella baltica]MCS6128320.1 signal recognition particle-docking protein FtsY [Shewanella baltica]MCS6140245.1 signal recognition particle-docking protein FtsY [Shewanella baltica]MCS6146534.1 signal recognition particle-docking protein FtsY [Shewanella baltica]MCS6171064.1 signal recognition particle-docking protein FtsY [Shewanella baltica]MCS6188282.1 signal recognition particle-docking protein FtsY [Shewanella baltica]
MAKKGFFSWFRKDKSQDEVVAETPVVTPTQDTEAAERLEQKRAEAQRLAAEAEAEAQAAAEKLAAEQLAAEQAQAERIVQEQAAIEAQRLAEQQAEAARLAAAQLEAEQLAKVQAERIAQERAQIEAQRLAEQQAETARQAAAQLEAEQLAANKLAAEQAAAEQLVQTQAKAEAERIAHEQAQIEAQRLAEQQAEAARLAAAQLEAEQLAADKLAAEQAAAEQLVQAQAKAEAERIAQEQAQIEAQRLAEQQAEALAAEQLAAEALAREQAEALAQQQAEATQSAGPVTELQPEPQARPVKEGLFARLKRGLMRTSENIGSGFIGLFRGKKIDDDLFEELEEQLLIADVGVETTTRLIKNLTEQASRKQLKDAEALYDLLREEMQKTLDPVAIPLVPDNANGPFVILMVGVNGVGKTTTIGKLAKQYQSQGKSVMLAAGDTFRAAAVEQLQVWGQRNDITVIAQHTGADSASVLFDALQAAKARKVDVLIADTAGRLQNKAHLMEELKKVVRVMKKLDPDTPHEVMLTLDASTGQNAISQAQLFQEAVGVTGITISKLDGTAKGGVVFAIADKFNIPIRYIGVGEQIDDLRTFNSKEFIDALFTQEKADS